MPVKTRQSRNSILGFSFQRGSRPPLKQPPGLSLCPERQAAGAAAGNHQVPVRVRKEEEGELAHRVRRCGQSVAGRLDAEGAFQTKELETQL